MTLRRQASGAAESSSGSGSDSSGSGGSSSSSGSASGSGDSDSSASDSPKPRRDGAGAGPPSPRPAAAAPPPARAERAPVGARTADERAAARRSASASGDERARPPRRLSSRGGASDAPERRRPPKKKSIFSPDNSSESDVEAPTAGASTNGPTVDPVRTRPSAPPPAPDRADGPSVADAAARVRRKDDAPPRRAPSRLGSADSASTTESDADAPARPSPPPKRATAVLARSVRLAARTDGVDRGAGAIRRRPAPRPPFENGRDARPTSSRVDSDAENAKPVDPTSARPIPDPARRPTVGDAARRPITDFARKLTRSASARKSRHVIGDVESDADPDGSERSSSKSPVKRVTSTKGIPSCPARGRNAAFSSTGAVPRTSHGVDPAGPRASVPERERELRCPLPGCDSVGHLSGLVDRHFTIDACPMYHNTTPDECRSRAIVTQSSQETRRLAQQTLAIRRTSQPSLEHRAYQLKVKEMRSKWKPPPSTNTGEVKQEKVEGCGQNSFSQQEAERAGEREPLLNGFVPDYDLNLFREAQAAAAYKIEEELKNMPSTKGTRYVCMGKFRMEAWYQSPYPPDAARLPQLYLCEYCLSHHTTVTGITRHRAKCVWRHPPGDEVYRKGRLGVWQVDGRRHKQYCQQLCLLAKFFLDHKTLYYDVEPFLFYVMTLADSEGCHTVGYFSKEKNSLLNYNVSCILTLPPYQRQGYGRLLIDFSYLLTRVEGKIGSPEKPLSDLGLISYRSYWKDVLLEYLCNHHGPTLSIKDLSQGLAINSYDIVSTLQALGMMKYWKGKHIILKKQDVLDEYQERTKRRGQVKQIDPSCLKWTPFVPPSSQGGG